MAADISQPQFTQDSSRDSFHNCNPSQNKMFAAFLFSQGPDLVSVVSAVKLPASGVVSEEMTMKNSSHSCLSSTNKCEFLCAWAAFLNLTPMWVALTNQFALFAFSPF